MIETLQSILLVEDSPDEARLLIEHLADAGAAETRVDHVETLGGAIGRLDGRTPYDVVLLDLNLPDSRDTETVARIHGAAGDIPIVVLTGTDDEQAGLQAVRNGAQDYLVKGQTGGRLLLRALHYAVERKRAQRAQRHLRRKAGAQRQWLAAMLDNAPAGICVIDARDMRVKYANRQFAEYLPEPWRETDLTGRTVESFHPQLENDGAAEAVREVIRTCRPTATNEYVCTEPDGTVRHFGWSLAPLPVEGTDRCDVMAFVTDVTAQARAREELERIVAQRTASLKDAVDTLQSEVAERRRAEQTLRETEQEQRRQREVLQTIVDNIPVMLVFYNAAGEMLTVNRAFDRITGWTLEEVRHMDLMAVAYPDPEYRREVWDYMMSAEPGWRDFTMRIADGSRIEVTWANVKLSDDSQIGIGLDVTDRKAAAEALRGTDKLLRTILETVPVGVRAADRQGRVFLDNPAGERVWEGVERGEGIRDGLMSRAVEQVRPTIGREIRVAADGRTRHIQTSAVPIRDDTGNVAGSVLVSQDVTRQHEAMEAVEQERLRLFSVLNMLPGFVCLHAGNYEIDFANHRFLDLFGDPCDRPCYQVMRGRAQPCSHCEVRDVFDSGESGQWEITLPGGEVYRVWAYPFSDVDGRTMVLELGLDVTEQKRLREEVAEISEMEREKLGRELHDSVGQILTGAAFLSQLLRKDIERSGEDVTPRISELTGLITEAIDRTRRISRGLYPVRIGEEGLDEALEELASLTARVYDVPVHVECDAELPELNEKTAVHLYHIAQEALTNALKHVEPSEVVITLACEDGYFVVRTENDGGEIPAAADRSDGLGMRIMEYRAASCGGALRVEPRPGGGTVVECTVPLDRE